MESLLTLTNTPYFNQDGRTGGFQEVWYLKMNQPGSGRALWLRFTILIRNDKTKEVAEVWAIFFETTGGNTRKVGIKNTYPLSEFKTVDTAGLAIADSCLLDTRTEGSVNNAEHQLQWSLDIAPITNMQFDFVPAILPKLKVVKNTATTVYENIAFTGWCELDGERYEWNEVPGMQGHLSGPRNGHSWAWGHCNCFTDASGELAPVIWDGLCARAPLGKKAAPPLTSMFFRVGDEIWQVNTIRDILKARSHYDFETFTFTAKKGGTIFEGKVSARLEDYAGVTYEDTDGSHLYCHNSKISDIELTVTSANGQTQTYTGKGTCAYEVVAREPHPDIPLLI